MLKLKYIVLYFLLSFYAPDSMPKHFILISAPGSGKGTFSQYMAKKYGYVHIGLGDICRTRIDNHQSIESKVLNKILRKHMIKTIKNDKQFILDNAITGKECWSQWEAFFEEYNLIDKICFLVLEASDETCINRMKNRIICRKCFHVSKKRTGLAVHDHQCKECGNRLSIRNEDHDSQFLQKRFNRYHEKTNPLIKKLEKSYHVIKISSEQDLKDLYAIYDQLHTL